MAVEGRIIILPLLAAALIVSAWLQLAPHPVLKGLTLLGWALVLFSLMFFRDPQREPPSDTLAFLAPADGRVVQIKPIGRDDHIGGEAVQVSIFLSVFNVHTQRVPFDGEVTATDYRPGSFLAAFNQRASAENEQAVSFFKSNGGNFTVKQIAGVLARRVISYMQPGRIVRRGERLGFIRFGSRVDIILPADFDLRIKVGDRVSGTTSIIGYFAS
jgi:phosphatidylserine decarboxylase